MRRRTAVVALLAIALHALSPLFAAAAPRAPFGAVEICTAHGTVVVEQDVGAPAGPGAHEYCKVFCFCHGAAAASPLRPAEPSARPLGPVATAAPVFFPQPPPAPARARAPPFPD